MKQQRATHSSFKQLRAIHNQLLERSKQAGEVKPYLGSSRVIKNNINQKGHLG